MEANIRNRIEFRLGLDFFEKPKDVLKGPKLEFIHQIGDSVTYKVWPGCLESPEILTLAERCKRSSIRMFISTNLKKSHDFDTAELRLTFC